MESTRKIGQDKYFLKILTFWSTFVQKSTFWKLDICTISELRMKKRVPKSECTRKIEWDRSVLKILTFWSRSRVHQVKAFSLSFFFFFGRRFGPGPVSRSVKSVSGGDVISDVIEQRACMRVARVSA